MGFLYITEDTAEWLTSSLASIKSNCLNKVQFYCCTSDMGDMTTPSAVARALWTVDEAIVKLKESTGGSLDRVEMWRMTFTRAGRHLAPNEWAGLCFPKSLQAGLLKVEFLYELP